MKTMALPSGAPHQRKIKHLAKGLGETAPIDIQGVSRTPPKLTGPPENGNAAPAGNRNGAKSIAKRAASNDHNYAADNAPSTTEMLERRKKAKHLEIRLRYAWDDRDKKERRRPKLFIKVRFYSRRGAGGSTLASNAPGA